MNLDPQTQTHKIKSSRRTTTIGRPQPLANHQEQIKAREREERSEKGKRREKGENRELVRIKKKKNLQSSYSELLSITTHCS